MSYPCKKYHKDFGCVRLESAEEEIQLGAGWSDSYDVIDGDLSVSNPKLSALSFRRMMMKIGAPIQEKVEVKEEVKEEPVSEVDEKGFDEDEGAEEEIDLDSMKVSELKAIAEEHGLEIPPKVKKADLIEMILAAEE